MSLESGFVASAPRLVVPSGACDCHTHVFGPPERYPVSADRVYTPGLALPSDLEAMLAALHLDRVVLIQASVYENDNRCMLDGLAALGERARAVAVLAPGAPAATLRGLHEAGVRGVRLNVATGADRPGAEIARDMRALADRIGPLGWHLQLFVRPHVLPELAKVVPGLGIDVVIDHMGMIPAGRHWEHPGLRALAEMMSGGRTWVKLAGAYRVGPPEGPWEVVTALARTLIETRPDRVVWGSDWPHTPPHGHEPVPSDAVMPFRPLDTARLLDLVADWAPDPAIRHRLLVDNPGRLYDFQ